jgi:hypothetical protein
LLRLELVPDGLDAAQIFGLGARGQGARINLAHRGQQRFCFRLGLERTEPQAVSHPPILGALNLIHMRAGMLGDGFHRHADRRRGRTQVDHERAGTAEAWRGRKPLQQVVDRQMPNFAGQWGIDWCAH